MPTVCLQCAMRAIVEKKPTPYFDEEPEAHRLRVHPDLAATQRERVELEKTIAEMLQKGEIPL